MLPPGTTVAPICEGDGSFIALDGQDGTGSGDSPVGMGDDMPLVTSIPEIQQGAIADGTWVVVQSVVVTTPRVTAEPDSFIDELFVQDQAGGPWSGLRVIMPGFLAELGVGVSDEVDVVGRVAQGEGYFALAVGAPYTEIVRLGDGVLPPAEVVPVDDLRLDDPQARAYEGIPIRVEQVMVTDDDPCDGEFVIEDTARVDDRFVPGTLPSPTAGTMLTAVEGVLVFASDAFEIGPVDAGAVE